MKRADFISMGGLLLGGLSIIAQNRLDTSLAEAADNNLAKVQRRQAGGTLQAGADQERSRGNGQPRPRLCGFQNTIENLLLAPKPKATEQ